MCQQVTGGIRMIDNRLVLTVPEVARALRISRASAYQAARTGELPTIRLGRRILVPRAALEKLVKGLEAPSDAEK